MHEQQTSEQAASRIPCAVLHADDEVQLAIEHRAGRKPVAVLQTAPTIRWRCADGVVEELILEGSEAEPDRLRLAAEIGTQGLLVAEFGEIKTMAREPMDHWIMGDAAEVA